MNELIKYFANEDGIDLITESTTIAVCSNCDGPITLEDKVDWDLVRHIRCDDEHV